MEPQSISLAELYQIIGQQQVLIVKLEQRLQHLLAPPAVGPERLPAANGHAGDPPA